MKRYVCLMTSVILLMSCLMMSFISCSSAEKSNLSENMETIRVGGTTFSAEFIQNIPKYYPHPMNLSDSENSQTLIEKLKADELDAAFIECFNNEMSFDDELEYYLIGTDATVFLTSAQNPINELSMKYLQDIYSTKINNWSELNGNKGQILLPEYSYAQNEKRLRYLLNDYQMKIHNISQNDLYSRIDFDFSTPMSAYSDNGDFTLLCDGVCRYLYECSDTQNFPYAVNEKAVFIDGEVPTAKNILSGEYPYLTQTYIVINKKNKNNSSLPSFIDWVCNDENAVYLKLINGIGISNDDSDLDFDAINNN